VLEVGAGYTSLWLLQALRDNALELQNYRRLLRVGECKCGEVQWCVPGELAAAAKEDGVLHCVDNMAHGPGAPGGVYVA
jgi:hypothetical protein